MDNLTDIDTSVLDYYDYLTTKEINGRKHFALTDKEPKHYRRGRKADDEL